MNNIIDSLDAVLIPQGFAKTEEEFAGGRYTKGYYSILTGQPDSFYEMGVNGTTFKGTRFNFELKGDVTQNPRYEHIARRLSRYFDRGLKKFNIRVREPVPFQNHEGVKVSNMLILYEDKSDTVALAQVVDIIQRNIYRLMSKYVQNDTS